MYAHGYIYRSDAASSHMVLSCFVKRSSVSLGTREDMFLYACCGGGGASGCGGGGASSSGKESGPESSLKLNVVPLKGDFNVEDNWTLKEFEDNVVKPCEGKGPILTRDLQVKLKDGVGKLGNVKFTDNSSYKQAEAYKKHFPPSWDDEVWRLVEIARGGEYCKRLNDAQLNTVEDLL
ncbi:hypothetical protein Ancab_033747 [Ancistrocladus abbreviatus]